MFNFRIALILTLITITFSGCDSHAYWSEAMQYHAIAQENLISKGICSSDQDCQQRALLYAESGEVSLGLVSWGGAYINLYETQDPELVDAIALKLKSYIPNLEGRMLR
ncbi:MAG TPA: hypothetical protein VK974_08260 [Methylophilaceae bacterium]|nr:hypothetical protein [Methylophilaceae bacterium]